VRGSRRRRLTLLKPAALPVGEMPSAAHCDCRSPGSVSCCCASIGASMKMAARPEDRCCGTARASALVEAYALG
jgi:hypothetical protein